MGTPERSIGATAERPTASRLVTDAAARLRAAGSPTPRLDAELLVGHALGRDRAWLHAHPEFVVDSSSMSEVAGWVDRRAAGEPVAYIRGFKDWFSMRIATDRRALIPRPETELLAESAISEIAARLVRDDASVTAWEVATGSGAVSLALAVRFRAALMLGRLRLVASDVSAEALELASENLASRGMAHLVTLACGDLLEPAVAPGGGTDLLIANLPYVASGEVETQRGSMAWEPRAALDGGADGLDLLRRLISALPATLAPHGVALLEVGSSQAEAVRHAAASLRLRTVVSTLRDLAGVERVVRIARI
jgi:release factor glutamine methyltransferase